jgi:hypothetical protein
MKVKDLVTELLKYNMDYEVLFSSDEELNCLRNNGQVALLEDKHRTIVIYGLDGSEVE